VRSIVLVLLALTSVPGRVAADPVASDWALPGADLANSHYSALATIDVSNVATLRPQWTFHTGMRGGFEATPIVIDGVMYLSTAGDDVVALDAATGVPRWRYRHTLRNVPCCGVANRGVAVSGGRVFIATADARLIALDRTSGSVLWDVPLATEAGGDVEHTSDLSAADSLRSGKVIGQSGIFANMAPQIYRDDVIVGITGVGYGLHVATGTTSDLTSGVVGVAGNYGTRGYYAAFDAKTGTRRWRWFTIPEHGWEGAFRSSTPDGAPLTRDVAAEKAAVTQHADAWRSGGGSAWTTPAIDAERGLMYVGVGNPSPQFEDATRPGDNLYSVSLVALDVRTGSVRWAYQEVPHDLWGYDVASPPVLLNVDVGGRTIPAVMQAGKTGWLYVLDRTTGALLQRSAAFVPQQNLFARPTAAGVVIAPGAFGGASWSPVAYDPVRQLAFVAAAHLPMLYRSRTATAADGTGTDYTEATPDDNSLRWGTLSAIDPQTGAIRWQDKTAQPLVGGVLATAGGLTFFGEGDGTFDALDSATGKHVWTYACDGGVNAPPITYRVAGKQYVAVAAGGNALFGYKRGDSLMSFALGTP
jgi:glucose dehydrogenase